MSYPPHGQQPPGHSPHDQPPRMPPHNGGYPPGPPPSSPPGGSDRTPQWGPPPSGGNRIGVVISVIAGGIVIVLVAVVAIVMIAVRDPLSAEPPVSDDPSSPGDGEGSAALQAIRDEGVVRIGIMDTPPFSYPEGDEATGSAPTVARTVFSDLGVPEHEAVLMNDYNALKAALRIGEIDAIAIAGRYDAELCGEFAVADPDSQHPGTFVVESGNPEGITDLQDVIDEDLTLGALNESTFQFQAEEAGVEPENMEIAPLTDASTLEMVENGDVDAFISSTQWLRWLIEDNDSGDDLELTEPFTPEVDGTEQEVYSGLIFAQENEDILDDVNPVLHEMRSDGRLLDIGTPFGIAEDNLPPAGMLAEDACTTT